ncbi:MAG: hypothetical protein ACTSX4_00720, partial [Candidatus Helarchaeota archaeon]
MITFSTALFLACYFLYRTRYEDKKLFIFFAFTFLSIAFRQVNEVFIFVFPIFPFGTIQYIEYVLYLINTALFFPLLLTFLQIRKHTINKRIIVAHLIFTLIFSIILFYFPYPKEYDYEATFSISLIILVNVLFIVLYPFLFYFIKEKNKIKKEKGFGLIVIGPLMIALGDIIFTEIMLEISYLTHIIGLIFIIFGFEINRIKKYVNLFNMLETNILIFNQKDKLTEINDTALQFFKQIIPDLTKNEFFNKTIFNIFDLLKIKDFEYNSALDYIKVVKKSISFNNQIAEISDEPKIINIHFHPLSYNEDGEIRKYLVNFDDVTQIIKNQEMLEDQKMKIEFFSLIYRELERPLFYIDAYSKSVKENISDLDNVREDFEIIEKNIQLLRSLIK